MADMNKALSHIVASLSGLISKINTANLQGETSRVRKTSDMTYHQFLDRALTGLEPIQVQNKNSSYALQEDLHLLNQLASAEQISIKTFEAISKSRKVKRSPDNLQRRYYETLYKIEEKDMKKIVTWVETEGIIGFLFYIGDQIFIQKNEPVQHTKRRRPASLDKDAKTEQGVGKKLRGLQIPNNCKELHETLKTYSKMVDIPMKTLLVKLDQVSGDLIELDKYVESKDARLLWSHAQDQILRNKGAELQILKRYRGSTIETRKKYLGIN